MGQPTALEPNISEHPAMTTDNKSSSRTPSPVSSSNITRTLRTTFSDWLWRHGQIIDTDGDVPLYSLETHMRNPAIIVHRMSSPESGYQSLDGAPVPEAAPAEPKVEAKVGNVTMHTFTSRIDTHVNGTDIPIKSKGAFKNGYVYESALLRGPVTWASRTRGNYFDLVATLQDGTVVMRMVMNCFGGKSKAGKIELMERDVKVEDRGAMLDELLITGLGVMQQRITMYSASYGQSAVVSLAKPGASTA